MAFELFQLRICIGAVLARDLFGPQHRSRDLVDQPCALLAVGEVRGGADFRQIRRPLPSHRRSVGPPTGIADAGVPLRVDEEGRMPDRQQMRFQLRQHRIDRMRGHGIAAAHGGQHRLRGREIGLQACAQRIRRCAALGRQLVRGFLRIAETGIDGAQQQCATEDRIARHTKAGGESQAERVISTAETERAGAQQQRRGRSIDIRRIGTVGQIRQLPGQRRMATLGERPHALDRVGKRERHRNAVQRHVRETLDGGRNPRSGGLLQPVRRVRLRLRTLDHLQMIGAQQPLRPRTARRLRRIAHQRVAAFVLRCAVTMLRQQPVRQLDPVLRAAHVRDRTGHAALPGRASARPMTCWMASAMKRAVIGVPS